MGREGELCGEYNLLCPGKSIAQFSRGIEGLPKWIRSQWMRMFEGLPKWIRSQWMRMFVEKKRCKGSRIGSPFIEGGAEVGGRSTQRSQDRSQR